jgi:hypothetical protein
VKPLLFIPDTVLWALMQMPLLGLMMVSRLVYRLVSTGYYLVTKLRRWAKGDATWQEHDTLVGQMDPKEIARIEEEKARARVWQNELADHSRGCDACWPSFVQFHYFMVMGEDAGGCDIGKQLRKRANESLGLAA